MMSKRKKKSPIKRVFNQAEEAMKLAIKRRDRVCQMCGGSNILQVDHCFSRTVKQLFFDTSNLTLLCSGCHTMKTFCVKGMEKRVDDLVRARAGVAWWNKATEIAKCSPTVKFTVDELEKIKEKFDNLYGGAE